eukprot:CAMPEP_0113691784 /NCGR_PEP_ID=MMETSP0038_2-20120614/18679_1 /TAXON_ID=2898 /ORGANISM="Cryptomonas paramecium" /LENGTH=91 /DNA_ID=CAMNT_0000613539 /DNA_START=1002 /DNA_END=1273 /DNA_ORIENTATION=- /assembly_acc=CAM_ASM_000170
MASVVQGAQRVPPAASIRSISSSPKSERTAQRRHFTVKGSFRVAHDELEELKLAARDGQCENVKKLHAQGVDIEGLDRNGMTPLMQAAREG